MQNIITALFGLGRATYNSMDLDSLRNFHAKVVARTIWGLVGIVLLMVGINYFDFKMVNLILSLILSLVSITILTMPDMLVATTVAGIITGTTKKVLTKSSKATGTADTVPDTATITREFRKMFTLYFRTVGDVFFWISIFGLFLGTISCEENPKAVATISVALIVFGYGSYRWGFTTGLYKKIVYNYAILVLIVSLLSFIPAHVQIRYIGYDMGALFHVSKPEASLSKLEEAREKRQEQKDQAMFDTIKGKEERNEKLSEAEETFLRNMIEKRKEHSFPEKISKSLSAISWSKSAEAKVVNVPAASAPNKIPQLCWKKQDGHTGNGIFKEYCSELTRLNIDGEEITLRARNGNIGEQVLVGNKIEDFEFKGTWTQNPKDYEGEWQLRFSPDFKTAVGWQTNKGDSTKIYTWIK